MEKTMMKQFICTDKDELLNKQILDLFTASQIQTFIDVANDSNSMNSKAILMNYRHEKYPNYDGIDEFCLDL